MQTECKAGPVTDRPKRERLPRELFSALDRAKPAIVAALSARGVVRIEWVVGFVRPYSVWAWLGTATDAERDALPELPFRDEVLEILRSAGLSEGDVGEFGTTKQSQETVDRDYEGSWFYALR